MQYLPNILSFSRIPLALVFLQENPIFRIAAIIFSMISDVLDGYLARRFQTTSQLGAILDPLADKFFVFFALAVFYEENQIPLIEAGAMLCRDFAVMLFGLYLFIRNRLFQYQFRSILCGKITTALQLAVLFGLTFHIKPHPILFVSFIILGIFALVELYLNRHLKIPLSSKPGLVDPAVKVAAVNVKKQIEVDRIRLSEGFQKKQREKKKIAD